MCHNMKRRQTPKSGISEPQNSELLASPSLVRAHLANNQILKLASVTLGAISEQAISSQLLYQTSVTHADAIYGKGKGGDLLSHVKMFFTTKSNLVHTYDESFSMKAVL